MPSPASTVLAPLYGDAVVGEMFDVELPLHFGDPAAEQIALESGCAVFDAGFRTLLRATGDDRVSFLQGMLSNDVARLAAGGWMDAAHLTAQGRIVADLRVHADADCLWLDLFGHRKRALIEGLEKFLVADDVEITEAEIVPLIGLDGPAAEAVAAALIAPAAPPEAQQHLVADCGGIRLRVIAASEFRGHGFLFCGPTAAAAELWRRACAAGAMPVGMQAIEARRIAAGVPWYGCDMDESLLAPEAGLRSAISFQKGCYLGQEVVERATARGQLQKKLVGLAGPGRVAPERGTRLSRDGDDVGWITSAAWSPTQQRIFALAYVRRSAWAVGTELQVVGSDLSLVIDDRVPSLV